ncbi:uncharacterized protein LOC141618208 [Silene latifolia]|uniref:uncharacterized protein LOC141618208 n=1 Tax=Silene latifolia TaxID=37657 RepID=UPI003D7893AA
MACVTTTHYSLSINGSIEGYFPGKRGLRQGDPLSPYLFVICMEILSRLLRKLPTHPGFSYHPKCVKLNLTHLVFADDLLVFTRGDLPSVLAVASCLNTFAGYSGLIANPMKTCLYFGGVPQHLKQLILQETHFTEGDFPFRYLGLPLHTSRLTNAMYYPLLEKIRARILHWANHYLSYAGKIQLITSVISALKVEDMCLKDGTPFAYPSRKGGVGILNISAWNISQMLSWVWKLVYRSDSLWARWTKHYILKDSDIWHAKVSPSFSWYWHTVLHARDHLLSVMGTADLAIQCLQNCTSNLKFQTSAYYEFIRPRAAEIIWWKVVHCEKSVPKHRFITLLAAQASLPTMDKLISRGIYLVNRCSLRESDSESASHLFFACSYAQTVGTAMLEWAHLNYSLTDLPDERNRRIFAGLQRSPEALGHLIRFSVCRRLCL